MINIQTNDITSRVNGVSNLGDANRKYATFLAYAYLVFYYVRPQEHIPGLDAIPISGVFIWLFNIWGALHIRGYIFKTPLVLIVLLGAVFGLSSIGAFNIAAHRFTVKTLIQTLPLCIALYVIFDSLPRTTTLFKFWCAIYFLMAIITFKDGGRGPGDFSWDNNDAALSLGMGLPIVFYTGFFLDLKKNQRTLIFIVCLVIVGAIVITNSRGGFLGLLAAFLMLWWFTKKRVKIAVYAVLFSVVLSGILLSVLPAGYLDEMESINDPNDSTRIERLRLWETAWIMYKDNVAFGVGVHNQRFNMDTYQREASWYTGNEKNFQGKVVHSLYFQVLSETGTLGAILYLYILFVLPLKLYRMQSISLEDGEDDDYRYIRLMSRALIVSMGVFIVAGAFISVAYYPHIFIWIALYAMVRRASDQVTQKIKAKNIGRESRHSEVA